jgi:hypothetical protein
MNYRSAKPPSSVEQQRREFLNAVAKRAEQTMAEGLTAQAAGMDKAVGAIHQITTDNMAIIERNARAQQARGAKLPQVACREGCDFCCFLRVRASIPEVVHIANHLRTNLDEAELAELAERIDANLAEFEGLDTKARANKMVPCPLLVEHRCIAHSVRPIQCRSHHSVDVEACKRGFVNPDSVQIPHYLDVDTVVEPILRGVVAAIKAKSLKDSSVLLPKALKTALSEPDAAGRWIAGEDLFADCVDRELDRLAEASRPIR